MESKTAFKDLTGMRFGYWTVLERADDMISPGGAHQTAWKCRCDCGTEKIVLRSALLNGRSSSCGCHHREVASEVARSLFTTHGETKTRLYQIWANMKERCENPSSSNYKNYGAKGVFLCDEWHDYLTFKEWSLKNGYDDNLSIDRIDVRGGYSPFNCRWADSMTQANNKRNTHYVSVGCERHSIAEWSRILDISYDKLYKHLVTHGDRSIVDYL